MEKTLTGWTSACGVLTVLLHPIGQPTWTILISFPYITLQTPKYHTIFQYSKEKLYSESKWFYYDAWWKKKKPCLNKPSIKDARF